MKEKVNLKNSTQITQILLMVFGGEGFSILIIKMSTAIVSLIIVSLSKLFIEKNKKEDDDGKK